MNFTKEILDFSSLPRDKIANRLAEYNIPLTTEEILMVQNEFLKRAPSLAECVLFSIEGSEHCSYKSSRVHLKQFVTTGPNVILGAQEDAGVVAVATDGEGHRYGVVVSHESHNHPSQIVPYEGAATGIGGNVRDVCCMGAEVVAVADGLRFGDINTLRTKWIHDGVVDGIAGYGNPLGIPNIAGDLYYDRGYNDNCLVTIITLGIVREDELIHSKAPQGSEGYDLILVGKPTDNSGFGGASFASLELEEEKKEQNKGAVQEPNAFLERHLLKSTYGLFALLKEANHLDKVGFKDLGAGGVACASVELADSAGLGAEIWLDQVHTSMDRLHPSVVLCSETQERFMWVAHPEVTEMILQHYNTTFDLPGVSELAQARVVGQIRGDRQYIVHSNGEVIVHAPAPEVTRGFSYKRSYKKPGRSFTEPDLPEPRDYNQVLLSLLGHENIASRKPVFETYDKQVQGRSVLEPGEGDAGVIAPFNDERFPEEIRSVGIALSTDHNPRFCQIDPYWGAVNAVVESMRNIVAVGASPQAVTDCLCFGNPENQTQMWEFVEATQGVADACKGIHLREFPDHPVPIIAGNVSFYNESRKGAIPPSPIIGCLGRLENVERACSMGFKEPGSAIFMVGGRKNECGGSIYYALHDELGKNLPRPDLDIVQKQLHTVLESIERGWVLSAHDISEGGVAVALAEMAMSTVSPPSDPIGCMVIISGNLRSDIKLFSETGGFLLEVPVDKGPSTQAFFDKQNVEYALIGKTTSDAVLSINDCIHLPVVQAQTEWENGLRNKLS